MSSLSGHGDTSRVPFLDGWRGLAIALVLVDHFLTYPPFDAGNFGVDSFFCLSGLLMSRILFVQRVPLDVFYKRRISRILPVFVVFVLGTYGVAMLAGRVTSWVEVLSTLAFLRTYIPSEPELWYTGLPIGHLWSLNVEEHSYILLSLLTLIAALRAREAWVLIALGSLSVGIELAYHQLTGDAHFKYAIRTEAAASHLLISAGYFLIRHRVAPYVRPWMPVATFALAAACYWRSAPLSLAVLMSPYLLAFTVNHLDETASWLRKALAAAPLRVLGVCSYSVYVWQQPFYQFEARFPSGVAFLCALTMGLVSFTLFEDPIRRWLNRRW